jgi:class 3 adenylate cyclase
MDHTTNRTFICSVVFLDIVEYSNQPVDKQIQQKSRFNEILSEAITDVAVNDRIILDTGDGAAISFLGDPEDALFVALNIRDAIVGEDSSVKPRLSIRIGINLGPVKLVQDINGQRNLIGDGINVAQRVMSFANPEQVLVSRSYFEVISRLSQEYAKLFHYEGSRADKHVREHQVYSVYHEEKVTVPPVAPPVQQEEKQGKEITGGDVPTSTAAINTPNQGGKTTTMEEGQQLRTSQPSSWQLGWKRMLSIGSDKLFKLSSWLLGWKKILSSWSGKSLKWDAIRKNRTMLYIAAALIVILISVPVIVWRTGGTSIKAPPAVPETIPEPTSVKVEAPVQVKKGKTTAVAKKAETPVPASIDQSKTETVTPSEKPATPTTVSPSRTTSATPPASTPEKPAAPAIISLGIAPWGEVYVDGNKKGVSPPLNNLQVAPGQHQIEIRNTTFPTYKQTVDVKPGEQLKIIYKFH